MSQYTFVPGVVVAGTLTNLPADAPNFDHLTSVVVETGATGGVASVTSPIQAVIDQNVYSGTAGHFFLNPQSRQWEYGTATTAGTVFILQGPEQGEYENDA